MHQASLPAQAPNLHRKQLYVPITVTAVPRAFSFLFFSFLFFSFLSFFLFLVHAVYSSFV